MSGTSGDIGRIAVVVTTYNQPAMLAAVLEGGTWWAGSLDGPVAKGWARRPSSAPVPPSSTAPRVLPAAVRTR